MPLVSLAAECRRPREEGGDARSNRRQCPAVRRCRESANRPGKRRSRFLVAVRNLRPLPSHVLPNPVAHMGHAWRIGPVLPCPALAHAGTNAMRKRVIVAGTGFEGHAETIRSQCGNGVSVLLRREPDNPHNPDAIAVYLRTPRFFGLLGMRFRKIGNIKAETDRHLARRMDRGEPIYATVKCLYAPPGREPPRVTLEVFDEAGKSESPAPCD